MTIDGIEIVPTFSDRLDSLNLEGADEIKHRLIMRYWEKCSTSLKKDFYDLRIKAKTDKNGPFLKALYNPDACWIGLAKRHPMSEWKAVPFLYGTTPFTKPTPSFRAIVVRFFRRLLR